MRKSRNERSLWAAAERLKGRVVRPAWRLPNANSYHSCLISLLDSEYHFLLLYKICKANRAYWLIKYKFFQISKSKTKKSFLSNFLKHKLKIWKHPLVPIFQSWNSKYDLDPKILNANYENGYGLCTSFLSLGLKFILHPKTS